METIKLLPNGVGNNNWAEPGSDGQIYWTKLGWGTAQVPSLVAALEYAEAHCQPKDQFGEDDMLTLNLTENKFTDAEKRQLRAAVPARPGWPPGQSTKFKVDV